MNYVDLTLPIVYHWRYPIEIKDVKSFSKGDVANVKEFNMKTHWYTHIDAPLHQLSNGKNLDEFPIENFFGKAVILDISYIEKNEPITAEMLEKALDEDKNYKIIFIKTCWEQKTNWETTDYWDNAPYITEEAAKFIRDLKPNIVGFDFPQDYDIRKLRFVDEHECFLTTHEYILKNNILMIEYLTNMWKIDKKIIDIVALPVALKKADGAQIRVIAIF